MTCFIALVYPSLPFLQFTWRAYDDDDEIAKAKKRKGLITKSKGPACAQYISLPFSLQ